MEPIDYISNIGSNDTASKRGARHMVETATFSDRLYEICSESM